MFLIIACLFLFVQRGGQSIRGARGDGATACARAARRDGAPACALADRDRADVYATRVGRREGAAVDGWRVFAGRRCIAKEHRILLLLAVKEHRMLGKCFDSKIKTACIDFRFRRMHLFLFLVICVEVAVAVQYYHGNSDYLCPLISVSGIPWCPVI